METIGADDVGGVQVTGAEHEPGELLTEIFEGHPVMTGGSLSLMLTVTFCDAIASKLLSVSDWFTVTAITSVLSVSRASSIAVTFTTKGIFQLAEVKVICAG